MGGRWGGEKEDSDEEEEGKEEKGEEQEEEKEEKENKKTTGGKLFHFLTSHLCSGAVYFGLLCRHSFFFLYTK